MFTKIVKNGGLPETCIVERIKKKHVEAFSECESLEGLINGSQCYILRNLQSFQTKVLDIVMKLLSIKLKLRFSELSKVE